MKWVYYIVAVVLIIVGSFKHDVLLSVGGFVIMIIFRLEIIEEKIDKKL